MEFGAYSPGLAAFDIQLCTHQLGAQSVPISCLLEVLQRLTWEFAKVTATLNHKPYCSYHSL